MKLKKKVYVGLSVDIIHEGHINILKTASKYGEIIVGLLTDEAIASYKNIPHLDFKRRKNIVQNIRYVKKVIPQNYNGAYVIKPKSGGSSVGVRIINTIQESGYNVLIDGELVLEELKSSELKPKPISVPNESIISILNNTELVYEGKMSFKKKAVYEIYIGKSGDADHDYDISLTAVNVLPSVNLSDDKPKSVSSELDFNLIEAIPVRSRSGKYVPNGEMRGMLEVSTLKWLLSGV